MKMPWVILAIIVGVLAYWYFYIRPKSAGVQAPATPANVQEFSNQIAW